MKNNIIYGLLVLWVLLIKQTTVVQAEQTKIGPPYPEVWGYDLSTIPAVKENSSVGWGATLIDGYLMEDGDVWFLVHYTDKKRLLIKFFKGEQKWVPEEESSHFFELVYSQTNIPKYSFDDEFIFNDGSKIQLQTRPGAPRLFSPDIYDFYFSKIDAQGNEKRYSILAIAPQVNIRFDGGLGDVKGAPFFYQKLYFLHNTIPLKDNTFIVFGNNMILRLDTDFKTKFKPVTPIRLQGNKIMRNFFVIEYSLIEELSSGITNTLTFPYYQGMHDALLRHFHNQYN